MATDEDLIIGIDLGTTNSCAACFKGGEIKVLENSEGDYMTPSFVYFIDAENTTVGKYAARVSVNKPEYGIYETKKFIGRPYNEKELEFLRYLPFDVINENGNSAIRINDHNLVITPEKVSEIVLQKIKKDVSEKLGVEITKAVITVPAHFTVFQRKATLKAAETAGFTVMKLLSEPTAAVLNYFFEAKEKIDLNNKIWLVYDLGGGTFDVAIAKTEVKTDQQRISILCVDGDSNLGGHNFNNLILKYFFENSANNIRDQTIDRSDKRRARNACNETKENLSTMKESPILVESFMKQDCVQVPFSRQKFEELSDNLFKKTIKIVDRCIRKSGIKKQDISEIILAGGSTRIKKIQEMLQEYFNGKPLNKTLHPELCVAKGAALQAAILSINPKQKEKIEHFDIKEVTSSSLGIADVSDRMDFIIKKDTIIPTSGSTTHATIVDKQDSIQLIVYEGEKLNVKQNVCLGTLRITNLTLLPPGKCKVKVTMNIDTNGILTVTAKEKHKDNAKDLEISLVPDNMNGLFENAREEEDDKFEEFAEKKQYFIEYCERVLFNIKSRGLQDRLQSVWTQCHKIQKELLLLTSVNDLDSIIKLGRTVVQLCHPLVSKYNFENMPPCKSVIKDTVQDILKVADTSSIFNNKPMLASVRVLDLN